MVSRCGWVKLNVVLLCRLVGWQRTSFNFAKRWLFGRFFVCPILALSVVLGLHITVFGFAMVGKSRHKCFNLVQMFDRIPNAQISTKAPISQNRCCAFVRYYFEKLSCILCLTRSEVEILEIINFSSLLILSFIQTLPLLMVDTAPIDTPF